MNKTESGFPGCNHDRSFGHTHQIRAMTRSRSAAVAVALCLLLIAACSSSDDAAGLGEVQGTTTVTSAAPATSAAPSRTTAAPATTTTAAAARATALGVVPSTPEEQAAVDAIDRWLELEDQAFADGTTEAVIDELDALMRDGSILVQGSLDLGGPVERTSRARIDRIWHPSENVTRMDVCRIFETPAAGEVRTAHTITATTGATPFLENETVYILERDGVTCPPDEIIEPVLATYERWMELNTASALDPTADATELYELSAPDVAEDFRALNARLAEVGRYETFDPPLNASIRWHRPETGDVEVVNCHLVEEDRGVYDAQGGRISGAEPGTLEEVDTTFGATNDGAAWWLVGWQVAQDMSWCIERS